MTILASIIDKNIGTNLSIFIRIINYIDYILPTQVVINSRKLKPLSVKYFLLP